MVVAVLLAASHVGAQTAATLDQRFESGRALRAQHRDAEALEHFRALFAETRLPRALAQVALAEAALGRWVDAETHLVEALAMPEDDWMRGNRRGGINLDSTLAAVRQHVGMLDVLCATPGAEVWVGGRRAAALPLGAPLHLPIGSVAFEVRAAGYLSLPRVVEVRPQELTRESVDLVAQPTAQPTASERPSAAQPPQPVARAISSGPTATRAPTGSTMRTAAWITLGGAALLLIGGGAATVVGGDAAARWNDDQRCLPQLGTRMDACADDAATAETLRAVAITSFIGGGVLAVSSVVLFAISGGRPREQPARPRVALRPGPGELGLSLATSF